MQPRIFHPASLAEGMEVTVTGGAAAHLGKVLRVREGDTVILFNGDGLDHTARIISASRAKVSAVIVASQKIQTESPVFVTLMQGICRNHRMDMLIQKSTELGVNRISPIVCERSVVKIGGDRAGKKIDHWRSIAISASEQCGRSQIPDVAGLETLPSALDRLDANTARLMLDPNGSETLASAIGASRSVALLIGPEGGLTDGERAAAITAGFKSARLGPRILRTETAPIAALSVIQYLRGDLAEN
jgi:16S rRNA (uracil1498-N3)-methyltransferase